MTNNRINGLLTCKEQNTPFVEDHKNYIVQEFPAKDGKQAWTKIKGGKLEDGAKPYRVVSVKPTGRTDVHGNISFNVTIEEIEASQNAPQTSQDVVQRVVAMSKDDYWSRKEERDIEAQNRMGRAHSQDMALKYCELNGYKVRVQPKELGEITKDEFVVLVSWFQRDLMRPPVADQAKEILNAEEVTDEKAAE